MKENPYVGPRSLRDGDPIFGRDRERANLRDLLLAQRVILLYSPSGAGKSSLIDAGLRPDLREKGFTVSPVLRLGRDTPAGTNRYIASVLSCLEEGLDEVDRRPASSLGNTTLVDYVHDRRTRIEDSSPDGRVAPACFVFDQFEELFTLDEVDQEVKADFMDEVAELLRDRTVWAVIAMREDFIARLDPYLHLLPNQLDRRVRLDFLDVDAARLAITRPAALSEVRYTSDALRLLVDDLRTVQVKRGHEITREEGPYVQPVHLQVVCQRMWSRLPEDVHEITVDIVKDEAQIDEALRRFFDDNVLEVATLLRIDEAYLRSWIQGALITKNGFRAQADADSFKGARDPEAVLQELENHYLLRSDSVRGIRMYELTHDRMVGPIRKSNELFASEQQALTPQVEDERITPVEPSSDGRIGNEIGIALGGRGTRAAVFGLGALLAVIDAGLNRSTVSISSVSGGSLANGVVLTGPDFRDATSEEFERHIAPSLRSMALEGLWGPAVYAYLATLWVVLTVGFAVAVFGLPFSFGDDVLDGVARSVVVVLAALGFVALLGRRSWLIERAIDRRLLGAESTTMKQVAARNSSVHHVMNTTEVQTKEPLYLTNRVAYGYRFGAVKAPAMDLRLSLVVQASLAEPGAFNPRIISMRQLGISSSVDRSRLSEQIGSAVLVDGSLYDALGTTWETQFDTRTRMESVLASAQPAQARRLLVVHGSSRWSGPIAVSRSPFRPFLMSVRARAVPLEHLAALQRRLLVSRSQPGDQRGIVTVQVDESPYRLPTTLGPGVGQADDAVVERSVEAMTFLDGYGRPTHNWQGLVTENAGAVASLTRLGPERTAELLELGYMSTLVNLFVLEGGFTLPNVDRSRFSRLIGQW